MLKFVRVLGPIVMTFVVASVFAAPAPLAVAQGKPATVTVGLLPPFPFYWASYVATEAGLFKEQGLSVEEIQLSRPSEAVQALVGGSVNFAQVSADAFINAVEAGAKIAIIGQVAGDPAFSVVVQPDYKSWSDLKGKTVAVSAPKDGAAVVFRLMARANGLKDGDYTFLSVGTTPNRYAALKNRSADAAILGQPFDFVAVEEGFRLLARSDAILPRYAFIMIGTNTAWAQAHRDEVTRYLRALDRATDWLYNPANKTAAIDLMTKRMRTIKRDAIAKIYAMYFEEGAGKIITKGARADLEGLRAYGQAMKDLDILKGPVDPARWTDLSYQQGSK
jgi:ABC-type nitrate/sulfonate/bicarbonate transport system substrate-binding protein